MQLHEKYGEDGFVILAITSSDTLSAVEARSEQEGWGINYRVVQDKGGKIHSLYGITSSPTTYLIDAEGIVTGGHIPDGAAVETMLKDVKMYKLPEGLPKSLAKAGSAFQAGALGTAHKLATKVVEKENEDSEKAGELVAMIDAIAADREASINKAIEAKDFIRAYKTQMKMEGEFKGTDHAKRAKELDKELGDKYEDGWGAAQKYLMLDAKVKSIKRDKDKAKMSSAFRALAERYKGTPLAEQCNRRAKELEEME